jgi:4-alpha-glucanotransferase
LSRLSIALVLHHHQPVGNLEDAMRAAFVASYEPVLAVLEKHAGSGDSVPVNLYYSGALLEWFVANEPNFLKRIAKLLETQAEFLGGPVYAPLLPLISQADAVGQLRMLSDDCETLFGVRPRGAWLPEFAWEPWIPAALSEAELEFTLLDTAQFVSTGLELASLTGPFSTEFEGRVTRVFPVSSQWPDVLKHDGLLVCALHVEQVGFADRLEKFLKNLESHKDVELVTLSNALEQFPTRGTVYLPSSQSPELGLWTALNPQKNAPVRGGSWRSFMTKYPEVNHLVKRAARVSRELHEAARAPESAWRSLYRAQCGNAYWHGAQGGVFENYLRSAAFKNLIEASNALEPRKYGWLQIEYEDFDSDGIDEVIAESNTLGLFFKPDQGGMLTELHHRGRAFNVLDTLSRRPEPETLKGAILDSYSRRALIDHFIGAESGFAEFEDGTYLELGDFTTGAFEPSKYRDRVTMTRSGFVRGPVGEPVPVELKKAVQIHAKESRLEIEYRIANLGTVDIITRFGSEWNFGMLADTPERGVFIADRRTGGVSKRLGHRDISSLSLRDDWLGLEVLFEFGREVLVWQHPIFSQESNPAGDLEQKYQSTLIMPLWDLDLPHGRSRRITYSVTLRER